MGRHRGSQKTSKGEAWKLQHGQVVVTLPPGPTADWPLDRSSSPSRQPRQPSGSRRWSPPLRAGPLHQHLLSAGSTPERCWAQWGQGEQDPGPLLQNGWLVQRARGQPLKQHLLHFGERSWSPEPWKMLPVASHQRLCTFPWWK